MIKKISLSLILVMILLFSLAAIEAGEVTVTDSAGDISIQSDEASLNDVNKTATRITSTTEGIYYGASYNATLRDLDNPLSNKTVSFHIDGIDCSNTTDNDGIAGVSIRLNPGNYTVVSSFAGDDTYGASNLSSNLEIFSTIRAEDISKYYGGSEKFSATFLDCGGSPLRETQVNITVNGKVTSIKTDINGSVSLAMDFKPGTYTVLSTNPVTGESKTTTLTVLSTVSSSDLKKVKGDKRRFTAKFFKSNGKPLSGKKVKITINGKAQSVRTNSKGKVKLSLNNLKKGKYTIVCYNRDGLSKSSTVQIYNRAKTKLSVNTSSHHTFLPNDTKKIKIKFSTGLGGDSKAGKSIRIKFNGVTYTRTTDSSGTVIFTLPVNRGYLPIEYEYVGDKFFKPSKVSNQLTILDTTDTDLKVKGTTRFGYGADTPVKVAFTAGGVTLAKKMVTLTINGINYTQTTDNKGIVSVPITLAIGNYTISYRAPGDAYVKGTSGSSNITVFKRSPSKLTWQSAAKFKDDSQTFRVLLAGSDGKAVSGESVELTIDGETYTAKTSSKGYATFKTDVALGKYTVSFKFAGNNDYLPTSASKSITVKLSKFKNGLNQRHGSASSAYLASSYYCTVNSAKIKSLVSSLTQGMTDSIDKAKAIFNYVRDNISYDYYYNSHKGAVKTLDSRSGNCADQAHLLISMYRTAGFKARYVHGTCVFSDGTFGHVWTQVLIDGKWIVGDPISYKNSLGKIRNWNTNTFRLSGKYLSLPF